MVSISLGQKNNYPRPSMKWITPKLVVVSIQEYRNQSFATS